MPAILRRRKLISIKPERKNAVTYRKEEVQAEVMTPPPAADRRKYREVQWSAPHVREK